jgi:sensor histidine kinase regulating citrate/malate metabolism
MENGSIATTKREKGFHGYGIKSIQYTVNKYDGAVDINAKNNWFDMQILIPIP